VNEFMVAYLLTVDERLLDYLDQNGEMGLETVRRLRHCTTGLLGGSVSPADIVKDWPDWYLLAPAFVAAYGAEDVEVMEEKATFLAAAESGEDVVLTEADRAFLTALRLHLDTYPEILTTEE
jgi:hypothetical protein